MECFLNKQRRFFKFSRPLFPRKGRREERKRKKREGKRGRWRCREEGKEGGEEGKERDKWARVVGRRKWGRWGECRRLLC